MKKSILVPYEKYQRLIRNQQQQQQEQQQQQNTIVEDQHGGLETDHILDTMPQRYKYKVGAIVSHILRDPQQTLAWDDAGQLLYKGTSIPGSHIVDLLKDSQYKHKGRHLEGSKEFYEGLKQIHLPATLTRVIEIADIPAKPPGIPVRKKATLKKWIHV